MKPVTVDVIVLQSKSREYHAHTSYGLIGQGKSPYGAMRSAQSVIINYLNVSVRNAQPLPQPNQDISGLVKRFDDLLALPEEGTIPGRDGLPRLEFVFYRLRE